MSLWRWASSRRAVLALAAALAVVIVAGVLVVQQQRAQERRLDAAAAAAAQAFAMAAEGRDLTSARLVGTTPVAAQEQYAALTDGLGSVAPTVDVTAVRREGTAGTADLRWTWPFGPDGWVYDSQVPIAATDEQDAPWGVRWVPTVVHPALEAGDLLAASRTAAPRADIVGRAGEALVSSTPVVEVGVQPSRATDPASLTRTLAGLLDIDAAALEERITTADAEAFVPVNAPAQRVRAAAIAAATAAWHGLPRVDAAACTDAGLRAGVARHRRSGHRRGHRAG